MNASITFYSLFNFQEGLNSAKQEDTEHKIVPISINDLRLSIGKHFPNVQHGGDILCWMESLVSPIIITCF